ncbi:MAG: hypothetical protein ACI9PP_000437 [Halobacteriales archaeon]|jgi:hypothetical protein
MTVPLSAEGPTLPIDLVGYVVLFAALAVTVGWLWYLYR